MEEIVSLNLVHERLDVWLMGSSEAWRYSGPFTRYKRLVKGSLPGLGIGAAAFGVYVVAEAMFFKDDHHGHGKDHTTAGH